MDYTKIGFYLSVIGTIVGVVSLGYSFYVGRKTNNIRNRLMTFHIQGSFNKGKDSIALNLEIAYKLLKENNFVDRTLITESLIELSSYKQTLSKDTLKTMKKLGKMIKPLEENYVFFQNRRKEIRRDRIGRFLYSLMVDLKNDFNENEKFLEGLIK